MKSDGLGTPIEIDHFGPFYGGFFNAYPHDVTSKFFVTINPPELGGERTVLIEGKQDEFYYPGFYVIYAKSTEDTRPSLLLSDTPAQLPVYAISYSFWIRWDCDGNGVNDAVDVALHPELDENSDGLLDSCDRTGWCVADFVDDGFVNGDDCDFFNFTFELGHISADINGDGFVTGTDFDAFAAAFEAGC